MDDAIWDIYHSCALVPFASDGFTIRTSLFSQDLLPQLYSQRSAPSTSEPEYYRADWVVRDVVYLPCDILTNTDIFTS